MKRRKQRKREPVATMSVGRLEPSGAGAELVAVSVGAVGEAAALWARAADAPQFHGRETGPGGAGFPVDRLARPLPARATIHAPDLEQEIEIAGLSLTFPMVQPMPGGGFLVVGPRARRGQDGTPPNAILYDAGGRPVRHGLFGDGIQHVLATPSGAVWVGYFDEGVFGNYGWGSGTGTEPIGASGLVRFTPQLEAEPDVFDLDIADCYALNVEGEAAWTCYYTDFPLVELRGTAVRSWGNTVQGAKAVAIRGDAVAFYGGYGDDADRLVVGRLADGYVQVEREYQVVRPDGGSMVGAEVVGRGPTLHFFVGPDWYRLDPAELLS
ncbi:MAG TPA: hypothetical protein VFH76_06310 [Kribbella sp.]|nr:hypothetical protein [Kribbella sp.]